MQFTQSELSTIRIAALGWAERCKAEAAMMLELAGDESLKPDSRAKAQANARASLAFEAEARALADRVRQERRA